jgi:hypothetical protein
MRRPESCPRRRPPLQIALEVDGATVYQAEVPPSGIAGDGPSRVHENFAIPAGPHEIKIALRDDPDGDSFDYASERRIELEPLEHAVIGFQSEAGEFVFWTKSERRRDLEEDEEDREEDEREGEDRDDDESEERDGADRMEGPLQGRERGGGP